MEPKKELQTTQNELMAKGHKPLSKQELLKLISGNTVVGDYEYQGHRIYKTYMNSNGEMEAKNDWGSEESGRWSVDEDGYLSVEWDGYWEDWSGLGFQVDGEIKFYDKESGIWRTSFHEIMQGEEDLEV